MNSRILVGDNLRSLRRLALEGVQVDSVVTDPPYGLSFMGKKWDYDVPTVEFWRLVYTVLKPGGYVLSFGGTRTYHRMACALEDAGFELRDMLSWLYGSGFPKSLDVSKAIDNAAGAKRAAIRHVARPASSGTMSGKSETRPWIEESRKNGFHEVAGPIPATPAAREWAGFGTALKPACEPIALARKPLDGKTVASNVLAFRTGALNIDGCRIELVNGESKPTGSGNRATPTKETSWGFVGNGGNKTHASGRWPANVLLDEDAAAALDAQSGFSKSAKLNCTQKARQVIKSKGAESVRVRENEGYTDAGGASRFFYCAKASARERAGSQHPTVKPVALMRYLCRLVTPPGGLVLDPFAGSGTTGEAALLEGFSVVLMERERAYAGDIRTRLARTRCAA